METKNINQLTIDLLYIPFHIGKAKVAVAYVESGYGSYVFCISMDDQFMESVNNGGVGEERLRNIITEEFNDCDYVAVKAENVSEKLFVDEMIARFPLGSCRRADRLTGESLDEFLTMPASQVIKNMFNKKIKDDVLSDTTSEERKAQRSLDTALENHGLFDDDGWEYDEIGNGVVCKHCNGSSVHLVSESRTVTTAYVDLTEDIHNDIIKLPNATIRCHRLAKVISQVSGIHHEEIKIEPNYTVSKDVTPSGNKIKLEFDALPWLVTNTVVNYDLGKVELQHVSNVNKLLTSDLNNPNCLGVLLDFANPTTSLEMLDVLESINCNIYIVQEGEEGPEIVIYRKAKSIDAHRRATRMHRRR